MCHSFSIFNEKDKPAIRVGAIVGGVGSFSLTLKLFKIIDNFLLDRSENATPERTVLLAALVPTIFMGTVIGFVLGGFAGGGCSIMTRSMFSSGSNTKNETENNSNTSQSSFSHSRK